jgi:signal transduction histidine kinase
MFRSRSPHSLPLVSAAALAGLLALLATLQYRWIGQVSELQRQRMQANLNSAGVHFSEDFDREVTRAFLYFHPEPPREPVEERRRVIRQLQRWRTEAPFPGLLRDLYYAEKGEDGKLRLEVVRGGDFQPVAWPEDLDRVRAHLTRTLAPDPRRPEPFLSRTPLAAEIPGLVIPLALFSPAPVPGEEGERHWPNSALILRFDERVITSEILPILTRRYFGSAEGLDYAVAITVAGDPRRIVYRSDPSLPVAAFHSSDAVIEMFKLRPLEELRNLWLEREGTPPPAETAPAPAGTVEEGDRHSSHHRVFRSFTGGLSRDGGWRLLLKSRRGSLETAVTRFRLHNLGISASILVLLAVTAGLMVLATQRAQRLARQQIEFVAGVSHELRTPLTAIRSAGQNLSDGVVSDPKQVRRYGELILNEGRRLSGMVEQVLELAGIQSSHRAYNLQPADAGTLLREALAESRWLLEERGAELEVEVAPGLPPVLADASALRRALHNLIENAVKYGGPSPWIGLRARPAGGTGSGVDLSVADRGPGIAREDLRHLFEPFYRGRDAVASRVPGNGLGLSIVRHIAAAHGGRVTVDTGEGGTTFTIHLPAAPAEALAAAASGAAEEAG